MPEPSHWPANLYNATLHHVMSPSETAAKQQTTEQDAQCHRAVPFLHTVLFLWPLSLCTLPSASGAATKSNQAFDAVATASVVSSCLRCDATRGYGEGFLFMVTMIEVSLTQKNGESKELKTVKTKHALGKNGGLTQ